MFMEKHVTKSGDRILHQILPYLFWLTLCSFWVDIYFKTQPKIVIYKNVSHFTKKVKVKV